MKMRCMSKTIVHGDVVKVGQIVDLTEAEISEPVITANFIPVESAAHSEADVAADGRVIVVAGLTREEAIMKLNEAGQRVSHKISDKKLAERFEDTFSATT